MVTAEDRDGDADVDVGSDSTVVPEGALEAELPVPPTLLWPCRL